MFLSFITRSRDRYNRDLLGDVKYWSLSARTLSFFYDVRPILDQYVRGRLLDAGAGGLNARRMLQERCQEYVSLDVQNARGQVDIVGDIQNMVTVSDGSFDTVYCSQVLEHVPEPWRAIKELNRVLKSGGHVIISVPHLSGLHEEPHDYYRYTPYGLEFLLIRSGGFVVTKLNRSGGLLSFLMHPLSLVIISIFWGIPGIRWLVWWANKILLVHPVIWLDNILKLRQKFPANILIVGKKP